jgi:hypothetical protein
MTKNRSCFWPWQHDWTQWKDKNWSRLVRSRPAWVTSTGTEDDAEVGLECIQERRCDRCGQVQLRSERTML